MRILLADDHLLLRQSLKLLLEKNGLEVTCEASDGREALRLARELKPDMAVLDIGMPLLNGLDATREIRRACPDTPVILLTVHREEAFVLKALRTGARGYVLKSQSANELEQAIREVAAGGTYLSPSVSGAVVEAYLAGREVPPDPLISRERSVLQLVAEGKSSKEIAVVLGVAVKTAESHRFRLMEKLDIHETAGLVRYAIRQGMIEP